MKQVNAGLTSDGLPFIRWCDGWNLEHDHFDTEGRWTRQLFPQGNRLAEHVTRWFNAWMEWPEFTNRIPEGVDISAVHTIGIPLVSKAGYKIQPEGFYYDWVQILRAAHEMTNDIDLELYIDASNQTRGIDKVVTEEKAKASEARSKGRKTLGEKLPSDEQIIQAYNETVKSWGGRWERGDQQGKEQFFIAIRRRADKLRALEGQIEYGKTKDLWNVGWRRVYTRCSQLGLLKIK